MAVVSISLPDALLVRADRLIESRGFGGRSELLRACVRDFLVAHAAEEAKGVRQATVTLVYPHGLERHFTRIRHDFSDVVRSMMHGHAGDACVEVFVLEGDAARVRGFADALRGARDALQVALVFTDAWGEAKRDAPAAPGTREEPKRMRGRKPSARGGHAH
jgi:CopG family nickel-responsive transcriptional regulator